MALSILYSSEKFKILEDIGKSIKLIQHYVICSSKNIVLTNESSLVCHLCHHLNNALLNGLQNIHQAYWPVLTELCHSDTIQVIQSLKNVQSSLGKGRAWLYYTLTEGSLQSYVHCLVNDSRLLNKYYTKSSLVRDASTSHQLLTLLAGLDHIQFSLSPDNSYLDLMTFHFNSQSVSKGRSNDMNLDVKMTSSVTSSLASPIDSGVALLDDDAEDGTSVSEGTINETDNSENLSLCDYKEDSLIHNEIEDNCINHQLVSLEAAGISLPHGLEVKLNCSVQSSMRTELENAMKLTGDFKTPSNFEKTSPVVDKGISKTTLEKVAYTCDETHKTNTGEVKSKTEPCGYNVSLANSNIICKSYNDCSSEVNTSNYMSQSCISCIDSERDCDSNNKQQAESIVRRRRHKKHGDSDVKIKRVSFHEDLIKNEVKSDSLVGTHQLEPLVRQDTSKNRFSWYAEDILCHRSDNKSDQNLKAYNKTTSENYKNESFNDIKKLAEDVQKQSLNNKNPPVSERGIPEGQEDPQRMLSSSWHLCLVNNESQMITSHVNLKKYSSSFDVSDLESILSDSNSSQRSRLEYHTRNRKTVVPVHHTKLHPDCRRSLTYADNKNIVYKTSILNRFIKSLTMKKSKRKKYGVLLKPFPSLYIRGVKPQLELSHQCLKSLDMEFKENEFCSKSEWAQKCPSYLIELFRQHIFCSTDETIYKIFLVQSSYFSDCVSEPLIAVLTNRCIYFVGMKRNLKYYSYGVMQYTELDAMIVGPNGQTVLFVSKNHSHKVLIVTGEKRLCEELMSHVEIAMRRLLKKSEDLPCVRRLNLCDMRKLILYLKKELALQEQEDILYHYSLVQVQDKHISNPSTPMGPTKSGYLMFRPAAAAPLEPWKPAYFILKAGVVYMFTDQDSRLPCRVIPLRGDLCHGCRRVPNAQRPHIFEIIISRNKSFQFAAADEYEASDWLQALVQSASAIYELERVEATHCTLLLTSHHIVICKERFPEGSVHILSCAVLTDIMAFGYIGDKENWCILEFACREVHENVGDWIIYFISSSEMLTFKTCLEELWSNLNKETFPVKMEFPVKMDLDESLVTKCNNTSRLLSGAWDIMLPSVEHE